MLKRIFTIALLTGTGQLFVIFALKYISQNSLPEQVKAIGQIDSLVLFLMNVIALGLQPAAMRNLALTDDWKQEYSKTQSSRFTLSILLIPFALLAFKDQFYLAFLVAPLIALSGDYALYGRGFPVKGALIALVRAVLPFLVVILFSWNKNIEPSWFYLLGIIMIYVITDIFISSFLQQQPVPTVRISSLKTYLSTLPLGLVSLSLYFIGIGVILIAQYFYPSAVLATAFVGLKFYVVFKGVLRIIQQAFLKEMIKDEVCLKIDQLSSLLGLTFLVFVLCFPGTFIDFFFGQKYTADKPFFMFIAIAAFIYSIFSSFTTRAMLDKKDNSYAIVTSLSALATLLCCIGFSYFNPTSTTIGLSILIGELCFATGMLMLMNRKRLFMERIVFIAKNIPFIIIPLAALFIPDGNAVIFFSAMIVFAMALLLINKNKFTTLKTEN